MIKNNLLTQHITIVEEMNYITTAVSSSTIGDNLDDTLSHINKLSGKLQVHLKYEDNYLYPKLMNDTDIKVTGTTKKYIDEMEAFSQKYMEFKNKFNTKHKISQEGIDTFVKETKAIMTALKNRIGKEEKELYLLIK